MMIRLLATAGVVWCSAAAGKSSDISIGQMKKKIEAAGLFTIRQANEGRHRPSERESRRTLKPGIQDPQRARN
jgi:hypothetical protein